MILYFVISGATSDILIHTPHEQCEDIKLTDPRGKGCALPSLSNFFQFHVV